MKKKFLAQDKSSFSEIIEKNCYYVDKTHLIFKMASEDSGVASNYFLSRPRRFGKSLLIDTMRCLFEGRKDLFKDLYIYDKWNFEENAHPVVRIDFSEGSYKTDNGLKDCLLGLLSDLEDDHQLLDVPYPDNYNYRLKQIIKKLYHKHNKKVVVLIDEYDSPVLDALVVDKNIAEANRSMLSDFFRVLKANQQYIRFVFITGISMFPKTNMHSGLNNVDDISLDPEYSTICGFTEIELKTVFAPELKKLKNIAFKDIKKYYNGYGWRCKQKDRVYNPYSIILLFVKKEIQDWWYQSCTPSFLYNILKESHLTTFDIGAQLRSLNQLSSLEIQKIDLHSLFFQMGVFTIISERYEDQHKKKFLLDYPNAEIIEAFTIGVMLDLLNQQQYNLSVSKAKIIVQQLEKNQFTELKQTIEALFADYCFSWTKDFKNNQDNNKNDLAEKHQLDPSELNELKRLEELKRYEGFYSGILYAGFQALDIKVSRQVQSRIGISDIEIELKNQVFILELKMLKIKDIDKSEQEALDQIIKKRYGARHFYADKKVYGIAMVFDEDQGNIVGLKHQVLFVGK